MADAPVAGPPAARPQGGGDVEALRRSWPQILDRLAKIKRSSWALVAPNATVARIEGDAVVLSFTTTGLAGAFGRGDHKLHLQAAVKDVLGFDCRVDAVAGDSAAPPPSFQSSPPRQEEPAPVNRGPVAPPEPPVEEPPGWGDSPKASASRDLTPPAGGSDRQDQARVASQDHSHPLDAPRDEDAPPLEEEPPYDEPPVPDGPADWERPSRPEQPGPRGVAPDAHAATPPVTDDPWSRAREQSPGRWVVGSESNVSAGNTGGSPTAPIGLNDVEEPEPSEDGTPAPPASPATSAEPAGPASPRGAAEGQSLYQRLTSSPQAQRGRQQATGSPAAPRTGAAGYDEISADDETIEESTTFGRKAVERLLGGTLIEETTLDGQPIIRR